MANLPPLAILLILFIAACAALGVLHIIAMRLRNDAELHILVQCALEARARHEARMHALRTGAVEGDAVAGDVVIVADEQPEEDFIVGEAIEDALPVTAEAAEAMAAQPQRKQAA